MVEMENFFEAARIPPKNWVSVVKIQLTNVARMWWHAKEARLVKHIFWDVFLKGSSLDYFAPPLNKAVKEKFIELK